MTRTPTPSYRYAVRWSGHAVVSSQARDAFATPLQDAPASGADARLRGGPDRVLTAVAMAPLALLAGLGLFALGASVLVDPEGIARQEHVAWLGVRFAPCPGCAFCGMSRAFSALAHGDFALARDFNPGVVLAWPLTVVAVALSLFGLARLVRIPLRSAPTAPHDPSRALPRTIL